MPVNNSSFVLQVHLNNEFVGTLTRLQNDRVLFAFDDAFREDTQRPTVSLWFKTESGGLKTHEPLRNHATPKDKCLSAWNGQKGDLRLSADIGTKIDSHIEKLQI